MKCGCCGAIADCCKATTVAVCQEAVFWIEHAAAASHRRTQVIAYLEGNVGVRLVRDREPIEIHDQKWFGRFFTIRDVQVYAGIVAGKPNVLPDIYQRGMNQRNPEFADALRQTRVDQVQYVAAPTELPRLASRRRRGARAAAGGPGPSAGHDADPHLSAGRRADAGPVATGPADATRRSPSSTRA